MMTTRTHAGRSVTRLIAVSLPVVLAVSLTGCGGGKDAASTDATGGAGGTDGKIKIAYIQKQGDQQYFVDQAKGAKDAAAKLGAEVTVINVGDDANKAINEVDSAISLGFSGIAIVVPDAKVGPVAIKAAADAKIPLLASDDAIKDDAGAAAPFVGFDGRSMGEQVGTKAGELFKAAGWTAQDTKIIRVSKEDLQTCEDRNEGALAKFKEVTGASPDVIKIGSDASNIDSQNRTTAALASAGDPKHWVVWGCNDESETGAVTALQNSGVTPANIIGVGLGAYLTCKDWAAGTDSGNKAALYISGYEVGKAAVEALVKSIKDKTPLPPVTVAATKIVDPATYKESGVVCS
jgi:L-arabinose transport system substrate-binding protein